MSNTIKVIPITDCHQCPYFMDIQPRQNVTVQYCKLKQAYIQNRDGYGDVLKILMPDWCPLPEKPIKEVFCRVKGGKNDKEN